MPAILTDNKANSSFVAFMPRQVLLGMKHSSDNNASSKGNVRLKPEEKVLLDNSIAHYLHRCGFSKTLRKLRSEAQIEKDNVKGSAVDLEEMLLQYLELCSKDAKINIKYQKKHEKLSKKDGEDNLIADMDNVSEKNKNKNKNDKSSSDVVVHQSGTDESLKSSKNSGEMTNDSVPDSKVKSEEKDTNKKCKEKKKKSKLAFDSLAKTVEGNQLESKPMHTEVKLKDGVSADAKTFNDAETEKKSKDKKKTKKDKPSCNEDAKELQIGDPNGIVSKKDNSETSNKDVKNKKKDSKKRKRTASEENDVQCADKKADEEPKRRKVENFNESKIEEQSAKTNGNLGSESNSNKENSEANSQVGDQSQKTYGEQQNGKTNGNLENTNEKSSVKRSQKNHGSVEEKPVKAFQRVKVEEVKFADMRLQDNSYWAKDGADSGYGAKAEEILGQVRGRDFRHEKTKKKRGTYRGGQIDLQSHSIKFNYSDDD